MVNGHRTRLLHVASGLAGQPALSPSPQCAGPTLGRVHAAPVDRLHHASAVPPATGPLRASPWCSSASFRGSDRRCCRYPHPAPSVSACRLYVAKQCMGSLLHSHVQFVRPALAQLHQSVSVITNCITRPVAVGQADTRTLTLKTGRHSCIAHTKRRELTTHYQTTSHAAPDRNSRNSSSHP